MSKEMQSVATLSALVMMADGREDPSEWAALELLAKNQDFEWEDFKKLMEETLKEMVEMDSTEEVDGLIHAAGYGLNPELVEVLFDDLIDVVIADNELSIGEIDVLVAIRKILRVSESVFITMFAEKLVEKSAKGEVNINMDSFIQSAETSLAEIDEERKEELGEVA
jgi:uncharacterized tellurite resistance protein B-like protein